jgi:hypothetical protein
MAKVLLRFSQIVSFALACQQYFGEEDSTGVRSVALAYRARGSSIVLSSVLLFRWSSRFDISLRFVRAPLSEARSTTHAGHAYLKDLHAVMKAVLLANRRPLSKGHQTVAAVPSPTSSQPCRP